jgi:hypothetical protein
MALTGGMVGVRRGNWAMALVVASIMVLSALQVAPSLLGHARAMDAGMIGPPAQGTDGSRSDSSRWKEYPNSDTWEWLDPLPANAKFNDVMWQPGSNVVVLVGLSGLIVEHQGTYWATIQSNTVFNLWHVEWQPSGDYALIVGNFGTVMKFQPGAAVHLKSGTSTRLQSAAWKSDGSYALICGWDGILLKYDGSKFTKIETGTHKRLYNITYSSQGGWLMSGEDGLLMTYDEPTGKVSTIATGIDDMLFSLDWSGKTALIVGANGTILKYKDGIVTVVPNSLVATDLYGIEWDEVNGYALIVGNGGVALTYSSAGTLLDISPTTNENLIALSFLNGANDAYVVGSGGIVYEYVNGAGWTLLSSVPFPGDWKDVAWAPNGSYALISGSGGKVLRYDLKHGLSALQSGVTVTLRAIGWAPNGSCALIVGDDGTVLKYNGTSFTILPAGISSDDLFSVDWRSDGKYALLTGSFGKILKFDGTNFYTILPEDQAQFYLFSVAFHPSDAYALIVGASGITYKCDEDPAVKYQPAGMKCLRVSTGVFTTFKDVEFRADGDYAMLVGMSGVVLKYKSDTFEQVDSEMGAYTFGTIAWKTGSIYPVIAGSDGVLVKYTGYGVVQLPCPSIAALNGISWNGSHALVVGERNQIMMYDSQPLSDPFASIFSPGEGQQFTVADDVDFSAFNSLAPDDASVQFFWLSNISGPLGTAPRFTSKLAVGHHRITLYVNATMGRSDSDHVDIYVKLNAIPPHPVISSPVNGRTYNTTDDILFDASKSTDPNGDALSLCWMSDIEGPIASGTGFVKHLTIVGIHMITLYAYDGIYNRSASVNITMKMPNRWPEVTIVTPKVTDVIHVGDQIRFEATATDKDGDALKYSWTSNVTGFLDSHKVFMGSLPIGKHRIEFHAEDPYKHNSTVVVNVTVVPKVIINRPPIVTVTWPDDGAEINGTVNVTGTASDPDGTIMALEYRIGNDVWRAANGTGDWSFLWSTTGYSNGPNSFGVRAYDGKNHTTVTMNVTIANKWKDVHVTIMYPANDLELSGNVKVWGNAKHDRAAKGHYVNLVEVRVDGGAWKVASQTDPWSWTFKTSDYKNGQHTLEARATDDEGTSSVLAKVTIRVKNAPPGVFGTSLSAGMFALIIVLVVLVIIVIAFLVLRKPSKPAPRAKGKARPVKTADEEAEEALEKEMAKGKGGGVVAEEE